MLKKVLIVVLVLVVGIFGYALTRPDSFRVERKATIQAAPDKVFALVNDFHQWPQWSPWEKLDPAMKRSHSGAAAGAGAVYAWQGNSDVGQGRMEIVESVPGQRVRIQLDFIEPMASRNQTEFILASQGSGATDVTWAMHGPANFMTKLMGVFVSMDSMVGKDFEQGLANLKAAAERAPS